MKNILFLCLFVVTLFAFESANAGKEGGNGGGLAEKYLDLAYDQLPDYINFFIAKVPSSSKLLLNDLTLLESIRDTYQNEKLTKEQIRFDSEKKKPGTFIVGGQVRIAVTGSNIGDPIYINTDLLYSRDRQNRNSSISFSMAIAVLIHEFGHHHGISDCAYLDRLGNLVAEAVDSKRADVSVQLDGPPLEAIYITGGHDIILTPRLQHLVVLIGGDAFEVTSLFEKKTLLCDSSFSMSEISLANISWSNQVKADPHHGNQSIYGLLLKVIVKCEPWNLSADSSYSKEMMARQDILASDVSSKGLSPIKILDCKKHSENCW